MLGTAYAMLKTRKILMPLIIVVAVLAVVGAGLWYVTNLSQENAQLNADVAAYEQREKAYQAREQNLKDRLDEFEGVLERFDSAVSELAIQRQRAQQIEGQIKEAYDEDVSEKAKSDPLDVELELNRATGDLNRLLEQASRGERPYGLGSATFNRPEVAPPRSGRDAAGTVDGTDAGAGSGAAP